MKATLEFDLNSDNFEEELLRRTLNATNAYLVLFDVQNEMRRIYNGKQEIKGDPEEFYLDLLNSKMDEYAINLERDLS